MLTQTSLPQETYELVNAGVHYNLKLVPTEWSVEEDLRLTLLAYGYDFHEVSRIMSDDSEMELMKELFSAIGFHSNFFRIHLHAQQSRQLFVLNVWKNLGAENNASLRFQMTLESEMVIGLLKVQDGELTFQGGSIIKPIAVGKISNLHNYADEQRAAIIFAALLKYYDLSALARMVLLQVGVRDAKINIFQTYPYNSKHHKEVHLAAEA